MRRGFSIVELMVAVAVLLVVMFAASRIFSTTGRVTAIGMANSDVILEAAALERQLREDFERLSTDGVFAIHCNAVRNDVNLPTGPLLNPMLPENAIIRSDQLVYFTTGVESIQTASIGSGGTHSGQSTASRIYFGHGFQLLEGEPFNTIISQQRAHDPNEWITPWHNDDVEMEWTRFRIMNTAGETDFNRNQNSDIDGRQPEARQWLLTRQAVLLADDDLAAASSNAKTVYQYYEYFDPDPQYISRVRNVTAKSVLWSHPITGLTPQVQNGRVDAAATLLNDIRQALTVDSSTGAFLPWRDGSATEDTWRNIQNRLVYYPRAERIAPSNHRVDQALTNHVIGAACSSVTIDWTWDDGVGYAVNDAGFEWNGVRINTAHGQPWFGLEDERRHVRPYSDPDDHDDDIYAPATTIDPENVERQITPDAGWTQYQAYFGYNRTVALNRDPSSSFFGEPDTDLGYTPWPSAIRVTLVLHDPELTLENGREFQFTIRLPERVGE